VAGHVDGEHRKFGFPETQFVDGEIPAICRVLAAVD
jgi:hypothetical protein